MAASISLDSSPLVAPPPEAPSIDAAAAEGVIAKRSSPRTIPPPVTVPSRSNDANLDFPQASPFHTSPLVMPAFVFPARPSTSAPSSYSRASGRRPKSVADLQDAGSYGSTGGRGDLNRPSRSPALPDFSFNPGASLPLPTDTAFLSPQPSPQSLRSIPIRPAGAGHRRGGSEFVGGNLRSGDAFTVLSSSPTKSESGLASPSLAPIGSSSAPSLPSGPGTLRPLNIPNAPSGPSQNGPSHGRRGHAHRRSAAISSHDLSDMLLPISSGPPNRGSSAPSSPAAFGHGQQSFVFPMAAALDQSKSEADLSIDSGDMADLPPPVVPAVAAVASKEEPQQPSPAPKATSRARVGFSDTLEFIPRPLSLVSTDTSSTVTARPTMGGGHSVSGSISSIISLNSTGTTPSDAFSPIARSTSRGTTESRPSTAGAVLERTQSITMDGPEGLSPRRRNSIPLLASLPAESESAVDAAMGETGVSRALPSPIKTPKRWSFFSLDPFMAISSSPIRPRTSSSESVHESAIVDTENAPVVDHPEAAAEPNSPPSPDVAAAAKPSPKTVTRRVSNKKKKKVKTWGILSRKTKARRKSRRTPTPPPMAHTPISDDEESAEEQMVVAGTIDEAVESFGPPTLLVTPSEPTAESEGLLTEWQPPKSPAFGTPDDDSSFAMIDLDAALGPFNTPLPRNAEWEAAQRAGGLSKRQLHSAAGMTRFAGPGMHYSHRRAESAPEMPPFNRAGIPRFGSSSAMADVFEEDEEDDDDSQSDEHQTEKDGERQDVASMHSSASAGGSMTPGRSGEISERASSIDIRVTSTDGNEDVVVETVIDDDAVSSIVMSRRGSGMSGTSDDDKTQPSMGLKSEYSASSLHDDVVTEEELRGYSFEVPDSGCDVAVESGSDSTVNTRRKGKDLAPVDVSPLHLPAASLAPVSPFSMSAASTYPSPRSPLSFDANRVSTAPSSATEDNFRSLLLGEPGPEVRRSMDIPSLAPSLASSTSTTTRDSGVLPVPRMSHGPQPRPYLPSRDAERPASFTYTAFGRRRSSLASLHRLINTSHGERSKLSMEVPLDGNIMPDVAEDTKKKMPKSSRTKRLSRMMQFWRSKDEATS